jgi:hypothetical protein
MEIDFSRKDLNFFIQKMEPCGIGYSVQLAHIVQALFLFLNWSVHIVCFFLHGHTVIVVSILLTNFKFQIFL